MTLVLFDSSSIYVVYWNADPVDAAILTEETYVPGACTPLYDAVGRTLTKLEKELKGDDNHSVVVTIITDGYENDSHEYNLTGVKSLIEHLKKEGWSFAYMGTDHDVEGVTVSLSITNVVKFEKTEADAKNAIAALDIYDLLTAFQEVLARATEMPQEELKGIRFSVPEKMDYVLERTRNEGQVSFLTLFDPENAPKGEIIVTFLALLELLRQHRVIVYQNAAFHEITIVASKEMPDDKPLERPDDYE